jgi:hypothetical protein
VQTNFASYRFILKEHQTSTEDQTPQIGGDENIGDNTNNSNNNVEAHTNNIIEDWISKNTRGWIFFSGR